MHPNIPFDIWEAIFAAVGEPATLARCALVSRSFWEATARSLYRNVRVAHIDRGREIRGNRAFAAIHAHPYLRAYVRTLTHEAMDVYRWAAHSKDKAYNDEAWADQPPWTTFLPLLPNLTTYTLTTDTHHISDKLLHVVVATLMQCPRLTDVRWMFIVHAGDLPVIMQLNMITHLSLGQPDTGAFSSIGPWLKQMPCLRSFYVRDASRLLPDLISKVVGEEILIRLVNLTLGGRPYLAPYQLLTALNETPDLETLDVYYNDSIRESRGSASFVGLPRLRRLTVRHGGAVNDEQLTRMVQWMADLYAGSRISELIVVSDHGRPCACTAINEAMIAQVSLRSVVAMHYHLSAQEFLDMVERAPHLEEMVFLADKSAIERLYGMESVGGVLSMPRLDSIGTYGVVEWRRRILATANVRSV